MEYQEMREKIARADMVLVGLGEEFDGRRVLSANQEYIKGCERIKEASMQWLLPAWEAFCVSKVGDSTIKSALEKIYEVLQEKNYFVVSVSTNPEIAQIPWKHGRIVMPCGSAIKKQCIKGCEEMIADVSQEDKEKLEAFFEILYAEGRVSDLEFSLESCENCSDKLVLNNIYLENYNEKGYLDQWELYRKWLQGTVNRQLLVLELGVGLKFPTVIRWPFEKVTFLNQKAYFCRVNEKLHQLTEELSGKGCGISQNSIEWLAKL